MLQTVRCGWLSACALLCVVWGGCGPEAPTQAPSTGSPQRDGAARVHTAQTSPQDLEAALRAQAAKLPYALRQEGARAEGWNPSQRWSLSVGAGGRLRVAPRDDAWSVGLELQGWGRQGQEEAVGAGEVKAEGARVSVERGELWEWFSNEPGRIEHGFVVQQRPAGEGALRLLLGVDGARARAEGPDAVVLEDEAGQGLARYQKLVAWDSQGAPVAGRMEVLGQSQVALVLEDQGALYPLVVDPDLVAWQLTQKVIALDGAAEDNFGIAVSISGDVALVGAYFDDDRGFDSGSAYLFIKGQNGGWSLTQKLTASDGTEFDNFGVSMSVSGDVALVGALYDDDRGSDSGSVYVFTRQQGGRWTQTQKLTASDGAAGDNFGRSVSVSGDVALVGALYDDDRDRDSGSAYLFTRGQGGTWSQTQKLTASDGAAEDNFGVSVSVSGDVVLVGAYADDDRGSASGSAYIFTRGQGGSWTQTQKVTANDGAAEDNFGRSVSVSGDVALVGALYDDDRGSDSGSAYVFTRGQDGTWTQTQKLIASDGTADDQFGASVSISGDVALVGALYDDDRDRDGGSAYVFTRGQDGRWAQIQELTAADAAGNDQFGASVSVSGDVALVAAHFDDDHGNESGSAYFFALRPDQQDSNPILPQHKVTASDNTAGDLFGASVSVSGDVALVGTTGDDDRGDGSGSAYVFTKQQDGSWAQTQKLTASDGTRGDNFGASVSISGDVALVGTTGDDDRGDGSGSAYIFTKENGTWTQTAKLNASDGAVNDLFGVSVSISGDVAMVGALYDDDRGSNSGSVYIFTRQQGGRWTQTQKLTASDGAGGDRFGVSVSVSGDVALVGALYDDDRGSDSGSAYIFTRGQDGSWTQTQKLTASDGAADDQFGVSVSISGDVALVGAYRDDDRGSDSGSAHVFTRQQDGTWSQTQKLTASDGAAYDNFGASVSVSGDVALVGAYFDDDRVSNSGSAYFFALRPDQQGNNQMLQQHKVTALDGAEDDWFGRSVSVSGDVALVGVPYGDDQGVNSGSAYIFTRGQNGAWSQTQELIASDGAAGDRFGKSVSVSGDVALVGASFDGDLGSNSGSAHIFTRGQNGIWNQIQKLTAPDAAVNDFFGASVSVSGDVALVGAYLDDDRGNESGSAYVFTRGQDGSWTQTQKLTASDGAADDQFGASVSISGDVALVGANYDDDRGSNSGSVYVFTRQQGGSWTQTQKLTASDAAVNDQFGVSVSISGDVALVGAVREDGRGNESGSAYIFTRGQDGTWSQTQKLTASDGAGGDRFGVSVSVSGDVALVGALYDDDRGSDSGSAYIFTRGQDGSWTQTQKLTASDGAADDQFGVSVSISGDVALVGAYRDDDRGSDSGSAHVFTRGEDGSWGQTQKLTAPDAASNDWFGRSVSVSGDVALVGACFDDDHGNESGSAHFFALRPDRQDSNPMLPQHKVTASDSAAGDTFGYSVSVSGDVALVGANYDDDRGDGSGSAYVFTRGQDGSWTQTQKLTASDGAAEDNFGVSVSVRGDVALVGAYRDDDRGIDSGSAYVFMRGEDGTWSQTQKLTASDGAAGDQFGLSVSISGDVVLVGALYDDDRGSQSGSAYIFTRGQDGTWSQTQKLTASDAATGHQFGVSVSIRDDVALVGASGSAYVFTRGQDGSWSADPEADRL
jgi:hypothetical protein